MKDNHLTSIAIYCDLQNVYSIQEQADLLLTFANSQGRLVGKKVYYNSQCKNQVNAKDKLEDLDFDCIDVPCPIKDSADNQLIADCLEDLDSNLPPDTILIVSGDGDFVKLVRNLQKLGKKVIILAQRGNIKQKLKTIADEFHYVDDLPKLLNSNPQPQTTSDPSYINYECAIDYMIEAIKTGSKQDKRTAFGYIDNLMRQLFPNYKGVSSIRKKDGTKFAKFGKFVDAAMQEGKIRRDKDEVFLIA